MAKTKKPAKKLNRVQAHAKTTLSDQTFNGHQTRESLLSEVEARFKRECEINGEVYTRTVKKELEVDYVKNAVAQVLGNTLRQSTTTIVNSLVDGEMLSDSALWDCWMEVRLDDGESILIRAAQADLMMLLSKLAAVKENAKKQTIAANRWQVAVDKATPFLEQGLLLGDAMRQLGLVFNEAVNS